MPMWCHYLGLRIPPTNLQDQHRATARTFTKTLADKVFGSASQRAPEEVPTQ
jgi:hypothetical protein